MIGALPRSSALRETQLSVVGYPLSAFTASRSTEWLVGQSATKTPCDEPAAERGSPEDSHTRWHRGVHGGLRGVRIAAVMSVSEWVRGLPYGHRERQLHRNGQFSRMDGLYALGPSFSKLPKSKCDGSWDDETDPIYPKAFIAAKSD